MTEPIVYTIKEAAAALKVSEPTLYRMLKRGEVRSVKFGRTTRIPAVAIDELVERAS